jgi:hypothetical protein
VPVAAIRQLAPHTSRFEVDFPFDIGAQSTGLVAVRKLL